MLKSTLAVLAGASAMTFLPVADAFASDVEDPWLIRVRGLVVSPDEDGTTVPLGGDIQIDTSVVPELDISYFFSENFAVEAIFAVTPHDVALDTGAGAETDLGDVWLLPPTILAQYHFNPRGKFRPYIGAGINYTVFFNEDTGPVLDSVEYSDEFGWALQAGVDIPVGDGDWFANVDVKKLFLETDVYATIGDLVVTSDVDIDPWIMGVGVGRRF